MQLKCSFNHPPSARGHGATSRWAIIGADKDKVVGRVTPCAPGVGCNQTARTEQRTQTKEFTPLIKSNGQLHISEDRKIFLETKPRTILPLRDISAIAWNCFGSCFFCVFLSRLDFPGGRITFDQTDAPVAQLDRVLDFGSSCCRFKSCRVHHLQRGQTAKPCQECDR